MNDEQIRQNAANYVLNFTPTGVITEDRLKCYIAGAHSRDEEIQELKIQIESLEKRRSSLFNCLEKRGAKMTELAHENCKLQEEIEKLRNSTISAQEMFDELDPNQKADFYKNNIAWARTCDLCDELKLRHEL